VAEIEDFATDEAPDGRLDAIRVLLDEAFAGAFTEDDWQHALGGHHIVVLEGGGVVAHAALVPRTITVGERDFHTGYLEAVATHPARQRMGFGTRAVRAATVALAGWHDLGALSTGSPSFYRRLGWERWRGPTFVRRGTERIRTPEDDGTIMVRRGGVSAGIPLTESITCDDRPGDVW
jgi:aminoglycoside 2'-N-acetyltransferase I